MSDPIIKIENMNKWFGDFQVLKNINLEVEKNKKIVVCGPSGSGKSTLIRCINRLEEHQKGTIVVDGNELTEDTKNIEKIRAEVGMVFQQFNLFPHLSILENITLAPIHVQRCLKKEAEEYGIFLLNQMGIESHANKYPSQLSGGEQQRVAIARALALRPELILFDEPTSALDPERINEVLDEMRRLADQGMTMVVVTHEISFAKEVADQVLFMDSGKIIEISTPEIFFNSAKHERSRKFLNQLDKY